MGMVTIDVDIDLSYFNINDIIEYLKDEGYDVEHQKNITMSREEIRKRLNTILEAFYVGNDKAAITATKNFLNDYLGRCL